MGRDDGDLAAAIEAALPGYEIEGRLAAGGFATVWLGRHRRLTRPVAVKQLAGPLAADPQVRRRFRAEAEVLGGLDHPHVVAVHDFVEGESLCLLVMEHLGGGTLTDRQRTGSLSVADACAVVLASCSALALAHARGVLHRDIKPRNLLFSDDGVVKLVDFGIAKIVGGTESLATADGQVLGSPSYMAPEQVLGATPSPATDVYQLATVLYELLAGRLPFPGITNRTDLLVARVRQPPEPLADVAGIPPAVADLLMAALAREPDERPADAETFGVELATRAKAGFGPGWLEGAAVDVFGRGRLRFALDGAFSGAVGPPSVVLTTSARLGGGELPLDAGPIDLGELVPVREVIVVAPAVVADPPVRVVLEVQEPGRPARQVVVDVPFVAGRRSRALALEDEEVSRRDVRVGIEGATDLTVEDLGSTNGSTLNGVLLTEPRRWRIGDVVVAGATAITLVAVERDPTR